MEYSFPEYRIISTETMISTMQESNRNNERFCFILGSGASVESGIPTGTELEKRWMEFLMGKASDDGVPPKNPNEVRKYAKKLKEAKEIKNDFSEIEKNWEEVQNGERSSLSSEYYFDLCALRFYPIYRNSYRYFERLMEAKEPSLGYRILAELLTQKNNLVVTTNFDSLTEDALFLYTDKKPLVINHELLANYISDPAITRPIIAKIHRGLLFTPLNSINDTGRLKKEWGKVLSIVFKTYTPIVIGYGGGDHSLMEFLQSERTELNQGIYWCYLSKYGLPNEKIQKLVEKKNGYLVSIEGFDAFMTAIGSQMCPNVIVPTATNEILNNRYQSRIDTYTKKWNELRSQSQQIKNMQESELDAEKQREQSQSLTYLDYLNRGLRFIKNKQFDQAADCFSMSIDLRQDFYPVYNNRGNAYDELGQHEKAISDYNRAIELNPNYSDAYGNRGVAYNHLEQYDNAIIDFNKAIELNPNISQNYNNRGGTYCRLGQYENAISDFNKALELNPTDAEVYYNLGLIYKCLGQWKKAIMNFKVALEINSSLWQAYCNRGNVYSNLGQYDNAISDYSKAIELNPTDPIVYNNHGNAYSSFGQYDNAIANYNKALELDPNYSEAYYNRGNAYYDMHQYNNAIIDYSKAIDLNPNHSKAYNNRGLAYSCLGKHDETIADYNKALELDSKLKTAYIGRAKAYRALGKIELAEEDERKAQTL